MTDEELLAAHVAGETAAFAELVSRHKDRLWSLALAITGHPSDAEDALQIGLLNAARAAKHFLGGSKVYTWLHRIVTNAGLDVVRARQRRLDLEAAGDVSTAPARPEPAPDSDLRAVVRGALQQLDPDRRSAIVLIDMFGYSVREAAEILGVPPGTIKSRCARGRAQLAQVLGEVTR